MPRKLRPLDRDGGPAKFPPPSTKIVVNGLIQQEVYETVHTACLASAIRQFEQAGAVAKGFRIIETVDGVPHDRSSGQIYGVCEKCDQPITSEAALVRGELWQDGVETTLCSTCDNQDFDPTEIEDEGGYE